jgi:hypothetical protein
LAPSSFSKRISKYPLVRRVVVTKGAGRCNLRQSTRSLCEVLPPNVLPITVLRALCAAHFCISSTISSGKTASISRV